MNEARRSNPFASSVRVLGIYIRAAALIFLIQMALYTVGFWLTQIPAWGLMAVVCALCGLVPRIGSLVGIGLVLAIAATAGTDLLHLAFAAGVWIAVQAIEGFWLTPRLVGKPLGLRPLAVFVAVLFGSLAFGPLGLLFAVPVLAVAMVWIRFFKESKQRALPATLPASSVRKYVPPISGSGPDRDR